MERRVMLAAGLSFAVLALYAQVTREAAPQPKSTVAVTAPAAPMNRKYLWRAPNGTVLAAVDSASATTEVPWIEGRGDFVATATHAVAPIESRGMKRRVFDFRKRLTIEVPPPAANAPVTDFLIGETHLGQSQLRVAQIVTHLLRTREIDAFFVEQPDDLTFDWTPFASLQPMASQAIAALQFRLIEDARADLAPYDPIFRELAAQGLDDDAMMGALERRLGRERFNALQRALETSERYEKSEYLSAMDYMYAALQLQGVTIPFHTMESRYLRLAFHTASLTARSIDDLRDKIRERDKYMVDKARSLVSAKPYRQVAWIVGALHLESLKNLLTKEGHTVHIAYDSLHAKASTKGLKADMMLLAKKGVLLSAAKASPPSSFTLDSGMLPGPGPSEELTQAVIRGFDSPGMGGLTPRDRVAVETGFEQESARQHLRGQPTWRVAFTAGDAGVIEVSKTAQNTLSLSRQVPLTVDDDRSLQQLSKGFDVLNPPLSDRLSKLNAMQQASMVFSVVDKGSGYAAYADSPDPFYVGNDPSALIDKINERLRSHGKTAVYVDLDGFSEERADSFETTCRLRQKALNNEPNLDIFERPDVPDANPDGFYMRADLDTRVPPAIETISDGRFKGYFKMTLQFLANVGGKMKKITVTFISTSSSALKEMFEMLGKSDSSMTVADRVAKAKSELKKRHGLSDEQLRVRLRREIGKTTISEWLGLPSENRSWRS